MQDLTCNGEEVVPYCKKIECSDSKCKLCSSENECIKCIDDYKPNNGICEFNNGNNDGSSCNIVNCRQCLSSDYCSECYDGYTFDYYLKECKYVNGATTLTLLVSILLIAML